MEKLQFCCAPSGRRGFLRNCVLLGAGTWVVAAMPLAGVTETPASAEPAPRGQGGFVLINGWVLPSAYFRDSQP